MNFVNDVSLIPNIFLVLLWAYYSETTWQSFLADGIDFDISRIVNRISMNEMNIAEVHNEL